MNDKNAGERGLPDSTFVDYCLSALARRGRGVAFTHGDREMTGDAAVELAHAMARVLSDGGLTTGAGIAVLSGNLPEAFIVMIGAQMLGARHTGLAPMGSESDHRFILEDSEAHTFVYDPRSYGDRARALAKIPGLQKVYSLGPGPVGEDLIALAAEANEGTDKKNFTSVATADDYSSIFYTGGTTGRPKGVVHTHRAALCQALLVQANWQWPDDIVLMIAAPITHAAGQLLAPALALSGRVVLVEKFDAAEALRIIEREKVSVTFLVPTMIYALLDHPDIDNRDLSSLATLVYGAAPMSIPRLVQARNRFGNVLLQGYGQTEIGVGATLLLKQDHREDRPDLLASAGRPPAGITATILDSHDREVALGTPGELCLRGTSVMSGYWKQPELTASALKGGWLHTGDIAVQDVDGYIFIVDRKKDMIISGGFNVYPREIEDVLHTHPAVDHAAVIGIPDDKWGEAVHALVKIKAGAEVDEAELKALVREKKGAIYTPKEIHFTDNFPLTAVGKIDKKMIRHRLADATK
ncbi:AMP-binding protein [Rhodococcus sp. T2V]|uniref:AMP-binding protein n=1 Tax=Rhodococcus sp. T2V TaxID=3034164 RepID=UPI0023E17176|nr:AMP-binding protein [Rhodococcus sp. T2V]MDF3312051.1 AMP-binding protein [Rhodococcus sp. T2V]